MQVLGAGSFVTSPFAHIGIGAVLLSDWPGVAETFRARLDASMRERPWERPVAAGQIDYWRVHAYALDRLDELLKRLLPDGEELDGARYRGRHHEGAPWFEVDLLAGAWVEPIAGRRGNDLVGLVGRVYGIGSKEAALKLAAHLGIDARRD